jgi:hypothetical protein
MDSVDIGQRVVLRTAIGRYREVWDIPGQVVSVSASYGVQFARVKFDNGFVDDLALGYLNPAPVTRQKETHVLTPAETDTPIAGLADERDEAERQAEGVGWLRENGYTVLEIGQSRARVTCPGCQHPFFPTGYQGNTPGTPDTLITHDDYPEACGLLMEWKTGPRADVRKEQKELARRQRVTIVWNLAMCLTALVRFENHLGVETPGTTKAREWLHARRLPIPDAESGGL